MCSDKSDLPIKCCELSKSYKSHSFLRKKVVYALDSVSFSIKSGQIVGLIGPNGAGKTTLLSILAGVRFPTSGQIKVCGHSPRSREACCSMGYVSEKPAFLSSYTGEEVLKYHGALLRMSRKMINTEAERLLSELDLEYAKDRKCGTYSQGMRQRLALGIALMNSPKVLLLDEISNGLDPLGVAKLRELLQSLSNRGTAILISSHRLSELEKLTKDYIYLHCGKIVSIDTKVLSQNQVVKIQIEPTNKELLNITNADSLLHISENELIFGLKNQKLIPDLVADLVCKGVRITGVTHEDVDIEKIFIQLFNENIENGMDRTA